MAIIAEHPLGNPRMVSVMKGFKEVITSAHHPKPRWLINIDNLQSFAIFFRLQNVLWVTVHNYQQTVSLKAARKSGTTSAIIKACSGGVIDCGGLRSAGSHLGKQGLLRWPTNCQTWLSMVGYTHFHIRAMISVTKKFTGESIYCLAPSLCRTNINAKFMDLSHTVPHP